MRRHRYKGNPSNIGRFGEVNPGDILELTYLESVSVRDEAEWELLEDEQSPEEREASSRVKPWGTYRRDLRVIPWEDPKLGRMMISRYSKGNLLKIVYAIQEVGGVIRELTLHTPKRLIVDAILEAASSMGWDKLTKAERLSLPAFEDVDSVDPVEDETGPSQEPLESLEPPRPTVRRRNRKRKTAGA